MSNTNSEVISLPEVVGRGYATFWNYKGRYRVVKGGRASKKSTTTALWYIYNIMKYYEQYGVKPNLLVIRQVYNTHRNSTRAQLVWAIKRLKVEHLWEIPKGDNTLTYIPSGQKILFRGLDDPDSITSIVVEEGSLCWVWFEEAYQIRKESDFNKIDMSIRGNVEWPLFKQITLTFNPWSDKTWLKSRFFDEEEDDDILAMTTTWRCNEFLDEGDRELFKRMKRKQPRRYWIEGRGNWGISEGLVYTNWVEQAFDYNEMMNEIDADGYYVYKRLYGLDFGYINDPTAFIAILVDEANFKIYIYDEFYLKHLSNKKVADNIKYHQAEHQRIWADNDNRTIDDIKQNYGISGLKPVKKEKIITGIQKLQDYEIVVHPRCVNTIIEFSNYVWQQDKDEKWLNEPIDDFNHLMDALRYACIKLKRRTFEFEGE